jgi:hypothetical protein
MKAEEFKIVKDKLDDFVYEAAVEQTVTSEINKRVLRRQRNLLTQISDPKNELASLILTEAAAGFIPDIIRGELSEKIQSIVERRINELIEEGQLPYEQVIESIITKEVVATAVPRVIGVFTDRIDSLIQEMLVTEVLPSIVEDRVELHLEMLEKNGISIGKIKRKQIKRSLLIAVTYRAKSSSFAQLLR